MIRLFTDTSANLPLALTRKHRIGVLSFTYTVNGDPAEYSEETDFDGKQFYDLMREGSIVATSLVNVGTFLNAFTPALEAGDDVIYVGMSGGISGTANAAAVAAAELQEAYPQRKVAAIDTYAASLGEGLLVLEAAEMLARGAVFENITAYLEDARHRMCQYFTVDDLKYLKRGGRISSAVAFIGNVLSIKPILKGDEVGHIVLCGKVRGQKHAVKALADKYDLLCRDRRARIGIAHADAPAAAGLLQKLLHDRGFRGECLTVYYEPVTGSHVGPGTLALFFPGTEK